MFWFVAWQPGGEAGFDFYSRLVAFSGDAPDQFRVLPWLVLGGIQKVVGLVFSGDVFRISLLVFWTVSAFACFEMSHQFFQKQSDWPVRNVLVFNGLFAILHPVSQLFGWKPDTLFCQAVCWLVVVFAFERGRHKCRLTVFGLVLLAFCRADVALLYGLFLAIYGGFGWPVRLVLVGLPIVVQVVLQRLIFADAHYYMEWFQLPENLKFWRLLIHPFSWLTMAGGLIFQKKIQSFLHKNWLRWRWAFGLMGSYILLLFVVARVNEWRLYWPILPLLMWIYLSEKNENSTDRTI